MFDAGAAVFTLTGHVVREPFDSYGRLVEAARTQKEHVITLGADVVTTGFDRFMGAVTGVKDATREAAVSVKGSMESIGVSTSRTATDVDRNAERMSLGFKKARDSALGLGDATKTMANVIAREDQRVSDSIAKMVQGQTLEKDKYIRNVDEMAAANTRLAGGGMGGGGGRSYVNPVGGGGGGGAAASEVQAKKTTAAWKAGFNTMANVGKWTTAAILGVGAISVKFAADFQRQMELIRTQVGYTQKQVDQFSKNVLDLAPKVGVAPTELAKGLYHVTSVLQGKGGTNEAMKILQVAAEGAKVGMANMEDVSSALMAIFKSGLRDVHSVSEAMGVMNDIVGQGNLRMEDLSKALSTGLLAAARNAHLGLRDVGAALDTMTSRGVPAEQAATRLRTTLTLMVSPTSKAQKALGELGLSSTQLATDMQKHGLVGALQDLQTHLDKTFPPGRKLTVDQEREALTKYGQQLEQAGVKGKTLETDLSKFKDQLDQTGSSAIKQSALITSAFGGSRMGTTMALLVQNADDVRSRFDNLNKANAAGRFQKDWQATQKDFSVQASQLGAAVRVLGIRLGDWLIPKVKALVMALIDAGKWLGRHKALADALAIAFGTILAGAVAAFFTRLLIGAGKGIKSMYDLGKAIMTLPLKMGEAGAKMGATLDGVFAKMGAKIRGLINRWRGVETAAGDAAAAEEGAGSAGVGGRPGGGGIISEVTGGAGMIEGMIHGITGVMAPGSEANPLAVVVMAGSAFGLGGKAAAAESATATEAAAAEQSAAGRVGGVSPGGVLLPPGAKTAGELSAAEKAAAGAGDVAAVGSEAGLLTRLGGGLAGLPLIGGLLGKVGGGISGIAGRAGGLLGIGGEGAGIMSTLGGVGGRLLGGAGVAGMGLLAGQLIGGIVPGKVGSTLSAAATGAGIGAGIGTVVPVLGTGVGALAGGVIGAGASLLGGILGGGPSQAQKDQQKVADFAKQIKGMGDTANISSGKMQALDAKAEKLASMGDITAKQREGLKKLSDGLAAVQVDKFIGQLQKVRDISGAAIFDKWNADFKKAGPHMKAQGAEAALLYAEGLQEKGELPPKTVQNMISKMEKEFPGLNKYLKSQGELNDKTLADSLKMRTSQATLSQTLKMMETQFGYMPKTTKVTGDNMVQQMASAMKFMREGIKSSTGQQRKDLEAAYAQMQKSQQKYLTQMTNTTQDRMAAISSSIKAGGVQNVKYASHYWGQYVSTIESYEKAGLMTVQQGNKLIAGELTKALEALGVSASAAKKLAAQGWSVSQVASSISSAAKAGFGTGPGQFVFASGGFLPGSEYGRGDVMTLVDPMGKPRARMAGDEAIFNRHQMPYVEAGLQMLGFHGAQDLWQSVNMAHGAGYEKGGYLPRFATGGPGAVHSAAVTNPNQYVFPFPKNEAFSWNRIDQGQDLQGPPGGPVLAIGPGNVSVGHDAFSGFGPFYPIEQMTAGPFSGRGVYYGHAKSTRTGHVNAGDVIGVTQTAANTWTAAPAGWLEIGFTSALGQGIQGQGAAIAPALHALAAGHRVMGIGGVGATWTDLKPPRVHGTGVFAWMAQQYLDQETKAANAYGRKHAASAMGGVGYVPGGGGKVVSQIGHILLRDGFNKIGASGVIGNAYGESTYNPASVGSGGGGLWGFTSGAKSLASLQAFAARAGKPWTDVGIQTQFMLNTGGAGLRGALNAAGSPASAASIFMNAYEAPANPAADLPSRAAAAQQAYAAGYGGGGYLRNFASGGSNPWAPLSSFLHTLPGFRPVRVRRGSGGLHTSGRSTASSGGSRSATLGGSGGSSRRPKTEARGRQHLSQSTADTLTALGFGDFVTNQNTLGKLDNQYSNQENLFAMAQGSSPLDLAQLDQLMGIREQEWDLLHKEWLKIPHAIDQMQKDVNALQGRTVKGHWEHKKIKGKTHRVWVPTRDVGGVVPILTNEVNSTETEITKLEHDLQLDSRKITTIHHNVTARVMSLADNLANQTSNLLGDIYVIQDKKYQNSQARINLQTQIRNLPTGGAATLSLNQIVSGVMSGALPTTGSSSANPAKKGLENQIAALHRSDTHLTHGETLIRRQIHALTQQKDAAARQYRQQGFDQAWAITLDKWRIDDKIYRLRQKLAQLKASLKIESDALNQDTGALQTLQDWQTGGLQGTDSIADSLEAIAYDMLQLRQQGADLPTPGRSEPTMAAVVKFLSDPPPKGMGLTVPAGLIQGVTAAQSQSFADFQAFQQTRASLLQQFGSNFVPGGAGFPGGSAGVAAGVQYYGAAAGAGAGPGAPGGSFGSGLAGGGWLGLPPSGPMRPGDTTINIHQNFAAGPPDPHTYSAGLVFELGAMT